MKEYYIKEWPMRILAILAITFASLWGCQTVSKSSPMPAMETIRITPVLEDQKKPTFIEVLRKACLEDGFFNIRYQGEDERYECRRVDT